MTSKYLRWLVGIGCFLVLILFYLFQQFNFASWLHISGKTYQFIFNKTFRFVLNDILMIGIIYALFHKKQFILFAFVVQIFGLVFILIPYFILKLYFHAGNGPLISFLHRLVLNPTLMILLLPAFWLQLRNENDG